MTNDHQMGSLLRSWLHETMVRPPDAHDSVRRVMAGLTEPEEAQRWLLRSLSPRSVSTSSRFPRMGGLSMVGTVKFITAAAIVVLFGGFLVLGIVTTPDDDQTAPAAATTSPSPMTTDELLSGMVTEEVEPRVFRIVNDGFRDLWHPDEGSDDGPSDEVLVGGNGAVWRLVPDRRLFRLGEEAEWTYHLRDGVEEIRQGDSEACPDNRLLSLAPGCLHQFDGGSWTDAFGIDSKPWAVAAGGDGTVWALGDEGLMWTLPGGGWDASDWADVYDGQVVGFSASDDGEAWLLGVSDKGSDAVGTFLGLDDGAWQVVPAPAGLHWGLLRWEQFFDVGPEGTLWTMDDTTLHPHRSLARLDGSDWTVFTEADGVGPWGGPLSPVFSVVVEEVAVEVAPDGSAWVNATDDQGRCDGLARFDGQTWTPYLAGRCVSDFDSAPDGSVWAVARSQDGSSGVDTYVIRPEAVATIE